MPSCPVHCVIAIACVIAFLNEINDFTEPVVSRQYAASFRQTCLFVHLRYDHCTEAVSSLRNKVTVNIERTL